MGQYGVTPYHRSRGGPKWGGRPIRTIGAGGGNRTIGAGGGDPKVQRGFLTVFEVAESIFDIPRAPLDRFEALLARGAFLGPKEGF